MPEPSSIDWEHACRVLLTTLFPLFLSGIARAEDNVKMFEASLAFVENRGQAGDAVAFHLAAEGTTFLFARDRLAIVQRGLHDASVGSHALVVDFHGAVSVAPPLGEEGLDCVHSWFRGAPRDWVTGARSFEESSIRSCGPASISPSSHEAND
jgi:hypothetical protein